MKCKCKPNSPFLWRNQPCLLDWGQMQRSADTSASTSKYVNDLRSKGIEPSAQPVTGKARRIDPKHFHIYSLAKAAK